MQAAVGRRQTVVARKSSMTSLWALDCGRVDLQAAPQQSRRFVCSGCRFAWICMSSWAVTSHQNTPHTRCKKKRWSYSRYRFLPGTLCIRNACDIFFKKPLKCLTRRILNFETFCKGSRKFGNSYIFDLSFTLRSVLRKVPLKGRVLYNNSNITKQP